MVLLENLNSSIQSFFSEVIPAGLNNFKHDLIDPREAYSYWAFLTYVIVIISLFFFNKTPKSKMAVFDEKLMQEHSWLNRLLGYLLPKNIYRNPSFIQEIKIAFLLYFLQILVTLIFRKLYLPSTGLGVLEALNSAFKIQSQAILFTPASSWSKTIFLIVEALLFFIAYDFGFYVAHRWMHTKYLWEYHKVHHSARFLTPLTSYRFHVVEIILSSFVVGISMFLMMIVIGIIAPTYTHTEHFWYIYTCVTFIQIPISYFGHYHLWISFGSLEHLLISPAMHTIHHSLHPEHFNKNFGSTFSIFDNLFRTGMKTSECLQAELKLGVSEDGFDWNNASVFKVFGRPLLKTKEAIMKSIKMSKER